MLFQFVWLRIPFLSVVVLNHLELYFFLVVSASDWSFDWTDLIGLHAVISSLQTNLLKIVFCYYHIFSLQFHQLYEFEFPSRPKVMFYRMYDEYHSCHTIGQ